MLNILLIEDNVDDQELLKEYLSETSFRSFNLTVADTIEKGKKILIEKNISVLIIDLSLPDSYGLDGVKEIKESNPVLPVIVLTGNEDDNLAIEAIKKGAQDYLSKNFLSGFLLEKTIKYAIERQKLIVELEKSKVKEMNAILNGQEDERRRIAQDLHDGIGQQLAGIKLNLNVIDPNNCDPYIINNLIKISKNIVEEYRAIVHNLRPPSLDQGVIKALQEFCKKVETLFSIKTTFDYDSFNEKLDHTKTNEIYRIAQELINNATKHSSATNIHTTLYRKEKNIELSVHDNGKGFDKKNISDYRIKRGIGLKNLETRAKVLKATYKINSEKNKGTSIIVSIPYTENHE